VVKGSTKVVGHIDEAEKQRWLKACQAKKAENVGGKQATGKRPRDDDEELVAEALAGKRKALEEVHHSVMGMELRLPPFDLGALPKVPFGMHDVFAEGTERVDFGGLRRQKKEVSLAMHPQDVPLVNVFLEGVKSDPEPLARTLTPTLARTSAY
ncbi:PREDICTED: LOC110768041 isoform, partial [Prunus dulcis]